MRKLFFTEFIPEADLCKKQNILSINIGKDNLIFLGQRVLFGLRQLHPFRSKRHRLQSVLFRIVVQNNDLIGTFSQPLQQLFIAVYNLG